MTLHRLLIILICCFHFTDTVAQVKNLHQVSAKYDIEQIKLNNHEDFGLINDVIQDNDGFIWFSSFNGLNVFDGHNLLTYSKNGKAHPLATHSSTPYLGKITKVNSGFLFIQELSSGSIICFDPFKRKLIKEFNVGDSLNLLSMSASVSGSIYAAYKNGQETYFVDQIDNNAKKHLLQQKIVKLNSDIIYTLINGNYWLINDSIAIRYNESKQKVYHYNYQILG